MKLEKIEKLHGREKVQWLAVSNKVNELIDAINQIIDIPVEELDGTS